MNRPTATPQTKPAAEKSSSPSPAAASVPVNRREKISRSIDLCIPDVNQRRMIHGIVEAVWQQAFLSGVDQGIAQMLESKNVGSDPPADNKDVLILALLARAELAKDGLLMRQAIATIRSLQSELSLCMRDRTPVFEGALSKNLTSLNDITPSSTGLRLVGVTPSWPCGVAGSFESDH